jgi:hypothetical protein
MDRRSFLTGAVALISSPAIVRAESLMPIFTDRFIIYHNGMKSEYTRELRDSLRLLGIDCRKEIIDAMDRIIPLRSSEVGYCAFHKDGYSSGAIIRPTNFALLNNGFTLNRKHLISKDIV